jgi:hypothetical protein
MAAVATPADLTGIINLFTDVGLEIIPLLGAVAFFVFVYGVARYIKSTGSEKEVKDSKNLLIWGVVGMFVMVTVWGIVSFIKNELGFGSGVGIPQVQFKSGANTTGR